MMMMIKLLIFILVDFCDIFKLQIEPAHFFFDSSALSGVKWTFPYQLRAKLIFQLEE